MRVPPRSQASWAQLRVSAENAQTINYKGTITQYIAVVNGLFSVCCILACNTPRATAGTAGATAPQGAGCEAAADRAAGWRVPRLELCAPLADLGRRQLYKHHIAIVIDFPSTDQAQEGVKIRTELAGVFLHKWTD